MTAEEEREVSYDSGRTAGSSGFRPEPLDQEGRQDIEAGIGNETPENAEGEAAGLQAQRASEIAAAARILSTATEEELVEVGLIEKEDLVVAYSGMLPHPDVFYKFHESHQERICRWNDSFTIDESRRQDIALDAAIRNANIASIASIAFNTLTTFGTIIAFVLTRDPHMLAGFALPGLSIVGNIAVSIREKGKDDEEPKG